MTALIRSEYIQRVQLVFYCEKTLNQYDCIDITWAYPKSTVSVLLREDIKSI